MTVVPGGVGLGGGREQAQSRVSLVEGALGVVQWSLRVSRTGRALGDVQAVTASESLASYLWCLLSQSDTQAATMRQWRAASGLRVPLLSRTPGSRAPAVAAAPCPAERPPQGPGRSSWACHLGGPGISREL